MKWVKFLLLIVTILVLVVVVSFIYFVNNNNNSNGYGNNQIDSTVFSNIRDGLVNFMLSKEHDDYHQEDSEFITINYHPDDVEQMKLIKEFTDVILLEAEDWFSDVNIKEDDLTAYLINENDLPHPGLHRDGAYDEGNKTLVIRSDLKEESLLNIYSHEFGHYLTMKYMSNIGLQSNQFPLWFHEGIADAFAHRLSPITFNKKFYFSEIVPFEEITQNYDDYDNYSQSYFAVERVATDYGVSIIQRIIDDTLNLGSFENAFQENTDFYLPEYHLLLEMPEEELVEIHKLMDENSKNEAEEKMKEVIKVRGEYFYQAPYLFSLLANIYSEQESYDEALVFMKKRILYETSPIIYKQLAEIAMHVDLDLALEYAEKALKEAEKDGWILETFEKLVEEIKNDINR